MNQPEPAQVPPELGQFMAGVRSLVPPPFEVRLGGDPPEGFRVALLEANGPVIVVAKDVQRFMAYLEYLSREGPEILSQIEQVLVGLARRANAADREADEDETPDENFRRADKAAEEALCALMRFILAIREC